MCPSVHALCVGQALGLQTNRLSESIMAPIQSRGTVHAAQETRHIMPPFSGATGHRSMLLAWTFEWLAQVITMHVRALWYGVWRYWWLAHMQCQPDV